MEEEDEFNEDTFGDDLQEFDWDASASHGNEESHYQSRFLESFQAGAADDTANDDTFGDDTAGWSQEDTMREALMRDFNFRDIERESRDNELAGGAVKSSGFGKLNALEDIEVGIDDDPEFGLSSVLKALDEGDDMVVADTWSAPPAPSKDAGFGGFPTGLFTPSAKPTIAAAVSSRTAEPPALPPMPTGKALNLAELEASLAQDSVPSAQQQQQQQFENLPIAPMMQVLHPPQPPQFPPLPPPPPGFGQVPPHMMNPLQAAFLQQVQQRHMAMQQYQRFYQEYEMAVAWQQQQLLQQQQHQAQLQALSSGGLLAMPGQQQQQQQVGQQPTTPAVPAKMTEAQKEKERMAKYLPLPKKNFVQMNKHEMSLVIRMQLNQLQQNDPLSDDFYYQVFNQRNGMGGQSSVRGLQAFQYKVIPNTRNADGSPMISKETLGRIASASLRKPRSLIALGGQHPASSDTAANANALQLEGDLAYTSEPKQNMYMDKSLVFLIEEGVRILMDIEDLDSLLAVLAKSPDKTRFESPAQILERASIMQRRRDCEARLSEALDIADPELEVGADHLVFKFNALPKGRLLLFRALLLFTPPHTYKLVNLLLANLSAICNPVEPSPSDGKMAVVVSDVLYSMPLPGLIHCFSLLFNEKNLPNMLKIAQSKLGCLMIQVFLKTGHEKNQLLAHHMKVHQETERAREGLQPGQVLPSPIDMEVTNNFAQLMKKWRTCFDQLLGCLKGQMMALFAEGFTLRQKENRRMEEAKAAAAALSSGTAAATAGGDTNDTNKDMKRKMMTVSLPKSRAAPLGPPWASVNLLWELVAALASHSNAEQKPIFAEELSALLTKEIEIACQAGIVRAKANAAAQNRMKQSVSNRLIARESEFPALGGPKPTADKVGEKSGDLPLVAVRIAYAPCLLYLSQTLLGSPPNTMTVMVPSAPIPVNMHLPAQGNRGPLAARVNVVNRQHPQHSQQQQQQQLPRGPQQRTGSQGSRQPQQGMQQVRGPFSSSSAAAPTLTPVTATPNRVRIRTVEPAAAAAPAETNA